MPKQAVPRPPLILGGNSQPNMRMRMVDNPPFLMAPLRNDSDTVAPKSKPQHPDFFYEVVNK